MIFIFRPDHSNLFKVNIQSFYDLVLVHFNVTCFLPFQTMKLCMCPSVVTYEIWPSDFLVYFFLSSFFPRFFSLKLLPPLLLFPNSSWYWTTVCSIIDHCHQNGTVCVLTIGFCVCVCLLCSCRVFPPSGDICHLFCHLQFLSYTQSPLSFVCPFVVC